MRAVLVAGLFLVTAIAGCTGNDDGADAVSPVKPTLKAPEGTIINETLEGYVLAFLDATLPFREEFTIPEGATMIRLVADPTTGGTISVSMSHSETGRRRCNQQPVVGFGQTLVGERSCSSLAAIDPPGTNWTAVVAGAPSADVRIEFYDKEPDGVAGMLDLGQLSHATHELLPTQYLQVPSFDGTLLWTEVTLPEGEGPWPTVIAASPYNGQGPNRGQTPAMWTYWTQDYAKRGYAAVNVDVRGFGMSGGCVEVWGINEQRDQSFIVDWVARQPWSDGNVGFYGQSYVGTTPVAAAVQAPEALKAIIAVAPVINAYDDWHYGGVPNGESSLSPVAYQVLTDPPQTEFDPTQPTDLQAIIENSAKGVCDPTLVPRANDPRAVYNEYYEERDFKLRAGDVKAAVLFTEGFEDANVKSAMIPGWFNELPGPKLGVFGHWLHQHPSRMDAEVLFLGWMDQYVKGKPVGFEKIPSALVTAEQDWHRTTESWPSVEAVEASFGLDFSQNRLVDGTGSGSFELAMLPVEGAQSVLDESVTLSMPLDTELPMISPYVHLEGSVSGENGFVYALLEERYAEGGGRTITWGMANLALRNGYDSYEPAVGDISVDIPLRPTEHIAARDSTLVLTLRGVPLPVVGAAQPQPAQFTLDGARSALVVPTLPLSAYEPIPLTARP